MRKIAWKFDLYVRIELSFVFFLFLNRIFECEAWNYCYSGNEDSLCKDEFHLMCHDSLLPKEGDLVVNIPMTKKMRSTILDKHNIMRDKIASGNETGRNNIRYPRAARMREMLWDHELAYMAIHHSSQCSFNHDKCHNTKRFPNSGQNLVKVNLEDSISMEIILQIFDLMYYEKNLIENPEEMPKEYIKEYSESRRFTLIVTDASSFVGCGLSLCKNPKELTLSFFLLTCNYELTNIIGSQIYRTDHQESASRCSDWEAGKSQKYENLCTNNGIVFTTLK